MTGAIKTLVRQRGRRLRFSRVLGVGAYNLLGSLHGAILLFRLLYRQLFVL